MYEMKCYPGDEERILVTEEFVKKNNLAISQEATIKIINNDDSMFGFALEVAMEYAPFSDAKHRYKDEFVAKVESGEAPAPVPCIDVMEATQDFLDYMVFAWMKANDERGISAARSIGKLSAWMKILSRPDVASVLQDEDNYPMYGKPALRKACEMLGIACPDYIR